MTRRFFHLKAQWAPLLEGHRPVRLPGIRCDVCGKSWGSTGTVFPAVDFVLSEQPRARSVPWAEYVRMRDEAITAVPEFAPVIAPGAQLGR